MSNSFSLEWKNFLPNPQEIYLTRIKEFQQEIIVEFEKVTGEELSKKYLPEWLANEIQRKKKKLSK